MAWGLPMTTEEDKAEEEVDEEEEVAGEELREGGAEIFKVRETLGRGRVEPAAAMAAAWNCCSR